MKIILTIFLCSFTSGKCLQPYQVPIKYNDMYDCLNAGYIESANLAKEIGRDEINREGIYIRFSCREENKITT